MICTNIYMYLGISKGLFIHLMPPMVVYTFMWHWEEVRKEWPEVFHFNYMERLHYFPNTGPIFMPGTVSLGIH